MTIMNDSEQIMYAVFSASQIIELAFNPLDKINKDDFIIRENNVLYRGLELQKIEFNENIKLFYVKIAKVVITLNSDCCSAVLKKDRGEITPFYNDFLMKNFVFNEKILEIIDEVIIQLDERKMSYKMFREF
jgi:hypothetical protein